jgi:hypothetical protein
MADQPTNLTALLDQQGAFLGQFAGVLGQYLRGLMDAGFSRDEAMSLVIDYHDLIVQAGLFGKKD